MTDEPGNTPRQLLRGLSLPRRVGHVVAGLGGLAGAAIIAQLWATEPDPLPGRTRAAFAVLIAIGLAWATFGAWALTRHPLFAVDRLIAGWLAVTFSTLLTAGMLLLALTRDGGAGALAAAGFGAVLVVAAVTALVRAGAYRRTLLARERRLHDQEG
jgi:hypothetical protein